MSLTIEERRTLRQRISCMLCNCTMYGAVQIYWQAEKRRVAARAVRSARPRPAPPGSILIGSYTPGIRGSDVLKDIVDAIASLSVGPAPT